MKTTISAQQTAHFTKNGSIEFEIPHPTLPAVASRDLWRHNALLREFILKKLGPIALVLTGKNQLRLGLDQWILEENRPALARTVKEMFCLQGFAIGAVLAPNPIIPHRRSPLGILPLPSTASTVLFFRSDLVLDWPHVCSDVLLILFTFKTAVYIHNPNDPATHLLKEFGYEFGDTLNNEMHPVILNRSN